jgi:hypothetical protein
MHAAGAVFDKDKTRKPLQWHGAGVEEIRGEDGLGLACPDRWGAGPVRASLRICHTVDGATWYPRPVSSPWMRR